MFSGIVQATVEVAWLERSSNFLDYALSLPDPLLQDLTIGASINVHGICQTVVRVENGLVYFNAIEETLKCTTLKNLNLKQKVNLERAAKFGDEIGGHMLSGHIIGTATITEIIKLSPKQWIITCLCDPNWMRYILPKGYIALNGASLTVVDPQPEGKFQVCLIPETLRTTTFEQAAVGEPINVEIDPLTQTIVTTVERLWTNK